MKKLRNFLIGLLVLLGVGYIVLMNIPKANIKGKEAAYSMNATDLFKDFEKNETAANKKYIGKVVEVSGKIAEKFLDENSAPVFIINSGDEMSNVMCTLESSEKSAFEAKKEGDPIKVRGQCSGVLMEVILNKGLIIE